MAFVSRVSTLTFSGATGSRTWTATAATQDTAEGGSVVITTTIGTTGLTPPAAHTALVVRVKMVDGTVIATFSLGAGAGPFTSTFHFTDTGAAGGSNRHGTVYIDIQATKSGGVDAYDYETDGSPSTAPAGFTATVVDRGWIRGTTTLVEAVSNISLGGGKTSPACYDESLFVRATLGSVSFGARALTVASSSGSLSSATNSTTAVDHDVTFSNVCDDRFPAAATVVTWTVTAPNDSNTGAAYTTFTSTTDDTITVDPRLTHTLHFQVDDNTFGTAKHQSAKQMLATQSGFLWDKVTHARGAGVNSITVLQTLTPTLPGTAVSGSGATSTQDGVVGVSARLDWTASKPGGSWTWTIDVTSPADIDADTHEVGGSDTVTMLAPNPNYRVIVGAGPTTAGDGSHWSPGDDLQIGAALVDTGAFDLLTPGTPSPVCVVSRFGADGVLEYLEDDLDTWTDLAIDGSGTANTIALVQASTLIPGADTRVYLLVVPGANTADWGTIDVGIVATFHDSAGTPYSGSYVTQVVDSKNTHSAFVLDAVGLALTGGLTFK